MSITSIKTTIELNSGVTINSTWTPPKKSRKSDPRDLPAKCDPRFWFMSLLDSHKELIRAKDPLSSKERMRLKEVSKLPFEDEIPIGMMTHDYMCRKREDGK